MIKRRIHALKRFVLNTQIDQREFEENDIKLILFKDIAQYEALLSFNNFKAAHKPVPIVPVIPTTAATPPVVPTTLPIVPSSPPTFACKVCEKLFNTPRGLKTHSRIHKDDVPAIIEENSTPSTFQIPEKVCPECGVKMVVSGEEKSPETGCKITFVCPVCQEELEVNEFANTESTQVNS